MNGVLGHDSALVSYTEPGTILIIITNKDNFFQA